MKNGQWTTNGFQEEKWVIEKFIEKIGKCSEAVVGYLTAALYIICWEISEAIAGRCSVKKMF